ncbi:MAG: DUF3667 domain-containing protein [Ginsengibacter sp.]
MSHLIERKEKNCLNCGTTVVGKYCHECGQENVEPKETFWQLASHFFSDMTHFDSKVFTSMKDLILKPGFLSKEYVRGRRSRYLNPIRMYFFTSFVFFLIFFSLFAIDENSLNIEINNRNIDKIDSIKLRQLSSELNNGKPLTKEEVKRKFDSSGITFTGTTYKSNEEYDSLVKAGVKKHNWFERMVTHKGIELNEKYHNNKRQAIIDLSASVQHSIPKMLFVLLPLLALFLKLLYFRHKDFYYTDHAIFTIHFYTFIFIVMLLIFGIAKINVITGAAWLQYINGIFILVIFFYLYKAMRNFYMQSRVKTILKYFLLLFFFLLSGITLFIIFSFISIFEI